ncbi:protein-L-isoaspartate O-methyltransferase [Mycena alexandri]|uniref:protein-L-isoaspartate(D-aspartate) O-methyltransferase n=1 Tax=Mycena alexandri TaxID=1745969 RepID=A0AAD6SQ29_9AGAR|nr:protein-L-isoaspartate O-methyltransferase [Mycena alexandri]
MAWRCSGKTNAELVGNLMKSKILQNSNESQLERISLAMQAVDRAHFVTDKSAAYTDSPQAIGHGATISAPHMHAYAADHLLPFLRPGSRVLDIGSGSGYLCAVLHHLVSSYGDDGKVAVPGKVIGIDHIPELVDWSLRNLNQDERTRRAVEDKQIEVHVGDGRLGKSSEGPYDAIHVGAASPTIPEPLVAQLARPGRMFIPVGTLSQHIIQVDKDVEGNVTETQIMAVNYVPLTDRDKQKPYTW